MPEATVEEVAQFDQTLERLRAALDGRLAPEVDLPGTLTAYAYWVCAAASRPGADWEQLLERYIGDALRDAAAEWESGCREEEALRCALSQARGPLLDLGAGWGRLAPLYKALGLPAVYLEPSTLGIELMRRRGLGPLVCARGEQLPFGDRTFSTVVIGWLLHHGPQGVNGALVLSEAARVCVPEGMLISCEPLREEFTQEEWLRLIARAGFEVDDLVEFYVMPDRRGRLELHSMAVCSRRTE